MELREGFERDNPADQTKSVGDILGWLNRIHGASHYRKYIHSRGTSATEQANILSNRGKGTKERALRLDFANTILSFPQ
ncbi:MAG: hypothetical protein PF795_06865 [Kiritimatiellae bacterium]|nr:hypothetical protein [Kiritimatiellia bacterium]